MSLTLRDDGEFYDDEEDFDDDNGFYEGYSDDDRVCPDCGEVFEDCECEIDNEDEED